MLAKETDEDEWTVDSNHDRGLRDGTLGRQQRTSKVNKVCKGRGGAKGRGVAGYLIALEEDVCMCPRSNDRRAC